MTQATMSTEIQRLLAELVTLNERYEREIKNDNRTEIIKELKNSIKTRHEQLDRLHEKLLGLSIE